MQISIAVLDDYQECALAMADWSPITARAEVVVYSDHLSDPDALVARLARFDAVCVMRERTPLPRTIIERLPKLKLVVSTGAGNASIDKEALRDHDVALAFTGYTSHGAIELTWALLLAAVRHIPDEVTSFRAGGWQVAVGGDLARRTLGIVGLGRIGTAMARIARAFEMDVIAWSPNCTPERAAAAGARYVAKDELFRTADFVSVNLVLGKTTRGIVGASDLGLMKKSAWLVNTSRGPLVDEAALIDALREERIAGAALDVFDTEPLPVMHPFRTMTNVIATSHVGFVTRETYEIFFGDTVKALASWLGRDDGGDGATGAP